MKKVLFILMGIIFFLHLCTGAVYISKKHEGDLKIQKIKRYNSFYLLEGLRNDSIFRIIAVINDSPKKEEKIKKGKTYCLKLVRAFPPPNFMSINEVRYFEYDGIKIKLNKKYHHSVYYVKNLNGLFFIEQ